MTSVRCARCGESVDLDVVVSARCPNCSALLDVTIDLESGRLTPARVALVVDDDKAARFKARRALEREGYEVLEASNGPDAALEAAHNRPTLALVDETMPAMSGEHASRLLRRTAPAVFIVAYTATEGPIPEWADASIAKDRLEELPSLLLLLKA